VRARGKEGRCGGGKWEGQERESRVALGRSVFDGDVNGAEVISRVMTQDRNKPEIEGAS